MTAQRSSADTLLQRLNELPGATAVRDDALGRVLDARASGRRVVLPTADDTRRARPTKAWMLFAVAAASLIAVIAMLQRRDNTLIAGELSGKLMLTPAKPAAGATIRVSYEALPTLAREKELVLRARMRDRWAPTYNRAVVQTSIAVLHRTSGGNFTGQFVLPPDVVYAAFVVEDHGGRTVDAHGGMLWDVLVHEGNRPTFEALDQQFNDVLDRSPDSALAIARRGSEEYPSQPQAWSHRVAFESYMLGSGHFESVQASELRRFAEMDSALRSRPKVRPEEMLGMREYAAQIADGRHSLKVPATYWETRLEAERPTSALARAHAISQMNSRALRDSSQARAASDSIEILWNGGDSISATAATYGLQVAERSRDSVAVMRFADRVARREPALAAYTYQGVARDPRLRDAAIQKVRSIIPQYDRRDDARRTLGLNVAEDERVRREGQADARMVLASMLLAQGDTTSAASELRKTVDVGWDLARFEQTAKVMQRVGGAASTAGLYARIAADPATSAARRDSLRAQFEPQLGAAGWASQVEQARRVMVDRLLASGVSRRLATGLAIHDGAHAATSPDAVRGDRVAVLVFWSRLCGPSRMQLSQYNGIRRQLDAQGIAFIPITTEAPGAGVDSAMKEAGAQWTSFYDTQGLVQRATGNIATPTYYVIDRSNRVRFAGHSAQTAITQAVTLVGR